MQGQVLHSTFGYFIQQRIFYINDVFLQYIIFKILFIVIIEFGASPQFGVPGACITSLILAWLPSRLRVTCDNLNAAYRQLSFLSRHIPLLQPA